MAVDYQKELAKEKQVLIDNNILESDEFLSAEGKLVVPFGTTESEELIARDLSDIPHILVSGFTGSGKSTFVRTLLSVVISEHSSGDVNVLIYDSKRIEYMLFNGLPHIINPIVCEPKKAVAILRWLAMETNKRLDLLVNNSCKDYKKYNEIQKESSKKMIDIIVVLDDIASLKLTKDDINDFISVLRNGRIVGIHVIVVSSMATTKSFQKELISIIPCKVCFKLPTKAESKAILERWGAESLIVPGEIIYKYQNDYYKCKSVYASYENIEKVMKGVARNSLSVELLGKELKRLFSDVKDCDKSNYCNGYDEYLVQAGKYVIENNKASIGMIQRMFKIGFNRSARILDQLAELGVVGPEMGTGPREVLVTEEQFEEIVDDTFSFDSRNYVEKLTSVKNRDCEMTNNVSGEVQTYEQSKDKKIQEELEEPDIKLRDFAKFSVGDIKLSIHDNKISYTTTSIAKDGKRYLIDTDFYGDKVKGVVYKKPSLFSTGYLTFEFDSSTTISNGSPELFEVDLNNLSNVISIKFKLNQDRIIKLFMKQISEDIGVPIKYV